MVPILGEFGFSCLFFATGASADETSSMLWYEELYLMLLDAKHPVTLNVGEAGISIIIAIDHEKHVHWWKLVEVLSHFGQEHRRGFLDKIREQLGLSENWRMCLLQNSNMASRFLMLDRAG